MDPARRPEAVDGVQVRQHHFDAGSDAVGGLHQQAIDSGQHGNHHVGLTLFKHASQSAAQKWAQH